nr:MAG: replication associated protein [Cressdnaviricota sp.]
MANKYSDWFITGPAELLEEFDALEAKVKYSIICWEFGSHNEEGEAPYEHYHMFLQYKQRKSFAFLKKRAPHLHIENRKGDVAELLTYIKKTGFWVENGTLTKQGQRTDYVEFIADAKSGQLSEDDMYLKHPHCMLRFDRFYSKMSQQLCVETQGAQLYWIYGPSRCGKSNFVKQQFPVYYRKEPGDWWWHGYSGQEVVLIDEITPAIPFNSLLVLADPGPSMFVPLKGGNVRFTSKRIYITSNISPDTAYPVPSGDPKRWLALTERCTFIECQRTDTPGRSRLTEVLWVYDHFEPSAEAPREFEVKGVCMRPSFSSA